MLIPILLMALGVGLLIGGILRKENSSYDETNVAMKIIGCLVLAGILIVAPLVYNSTVCRNAELDAFYYATCENYAYAVNETANILTVSREAVENSLIPVEGSVEKLDVGELVAVRVAEYRDAVTEYNEDLARIRALDKNIFVGLLYPTPNQELRLISIK